MRPPNPQVKKGVVSVKTFTAEHNYSSSKDTTEICINLRVNDMREFPQIIVVSLIKSITETKTFLAEIECTKHSS